MVETPQKKQCTLVFCRLNPQGGTHEAYNTGVACRYTVYGAGCHGGNGRHGE